MAFNGTEGEEITLANASSMTKKYRHDYPNQTLGHFFGKEIIERILDQSDAMGIRVYYGIDEDGKKQLILVGVDADENDLTNLVADVSFPCPDACSVPNALNS